MTKTMRYSYGVLAGFLLIASVLTGCGPKATETPAISPQQKTSDKAKALEPLPPEATVKLDELQPAIEKPVNPADADKLGDRTGEIVPKAEKALADKDYTEARSLLERAVGFEPDNRRILRGLGLAYFGLHNPGRAMQSLAAAVKIAPDDFEAQYILGKLYSANSQTDEAVTALRTAMKCTGFTGERPEAAETMLLLGRALQNQKKWRASLDCYEKLEEWLGQYGQAYQDTPELAKLLLEPEEMLTRRGILLLSLREPVEAAKLLERSYNRNRTQIATVQALLAAWVESKQYSNAEKLLIDVAGESGLRPFLPGMAKSLCEASGDKIMPQRIWEACVKKNYADQSLAVVLADSARQLGAENEAFDLLMSVLKNTPGSLAVTQYLVDMYVSQGRFDKALAILADMVHVNPSLGSAITRNIENMLFAGMSDEAVKAFMDKAAADSSEKACSLHYVAAVIAYQRGDAETAIAECDKAVGLNGKFYPAYELLMAVYVNRGEKDKADDVVKRLKAAGDDEFYVYTAEGKLALSQRRDDDALKTLKKAYEKNPDDIPTIINLAMACVIKSQGRQAENLLKEAVGLAPDNPLPYVHLFDYYLMNRAVGQARSVAYALYSRNPYSVEAGILMIKLDMASRRRDLVMQDIKTLMAQAPYDVDVKLLDVDIRVNRTEDKGKLPDDEFKEVVGILKDIVSRLPGRSDARQKLAEVLIRQGDYGQAAQVWAELYASSSNNVQAGKSYATSLLQLKRYDEAVKVLEELLAKEPRDTHLQGALFDSLVEIKQYDKAVEYAETWMKEATDPNIERYYTAKLMDIYKTQKQYDKIQGLLDRQIRRSTSDKEINHLKMMKLVAYDETKQYDEAIEFVQEWTKDSPENTDPRQYLLGMLERAELYDKALALVDEWLAAARRDPGTAKQAEMYGFSRVFVLTGAKRYDEAAKYLTEWITEDPVDIRKKVLLVDVLSENEKYEEALKLLDEWMAWAKAELAKTDDGEAGNAGEKPTPEQMKAHAEELLQWCRSRSVGMLMYMGKYDDAIRRADEYIALQEDDQVDLMSIKSSVLGEMGRDKEALAVLEKAIELDPDDANLNNNLGYMYADMGIELPKAERMIRKALAEVKADHILDSLGWVLYKQGRFVDASRVFEQILSKTEQGAGLDTVVLNHAADNYYRMGQKDKAVELWRKALDGAKKEKRPSREARLTIESLPGKIHAVEQNTEPELAPLGKDVKPEDKSESSTEK